MAVVCSVPPTPGLARVSHVSAWAFPSFIYPLHAYIKMLMSYVCAPYFQNMTSTSIQSTSGSSVMAKNSKSYSTTSGRFPASTTSVPSGTMHTWLHFIYFTHCAGSWTKRKHSDKQHSDNPEKVDGEYIGMCRENVHACFFL